MSVSSEQWQTGAILERVGPSEEFVVDGCDAIWRIESGAVDMFWVDETSNSMGGSRRHVMRVSAGSAVFGISEKLAGASLIAVPVPNSSILLLDRHEARSGRYATVGVDAISLLDDWIDHLGEVIGAGQASQGRSINLEAGGTYQIPPPTRAVFPLDGVVWVRHRGGGSFLLRKMNLPAIGGQGLFPVSRGAWLQSSPGGEIDAFASKSLSELDPEWKGLDKFHSLAMAVLKDTFAKASKKEQDALQSRLLADKTRYHEGLKALSTPLRKNRFFSASGTSCSNPVYLAAAAVGKKMGIRIVPHPDMIKNLPVDDPVRMIAAASAVRTRRIILKGTWYKQALGPLLAFRGDEKAPVALLPNAYSGYRIYDPVSATSVPLSAESAATIDAFCYMFYRPFPAKKLTGWQVFKFGLFGCTMELLVLIGTGIAAGLLSMVTPVATQIVIDELIPGSRRTELIEMMVFMLAMAISSSLFTYVRGYAVLRLQGKVDASLQAATWDRLLSLPASFFRRFTSGDLAQRSLGITMIREALTGSTLAAILTGIFSLFNFGLMFYYNIILALLATGMVFIAFVVSCICGFFQLRLQRRIVERAGTISSLLLQFIEGIVKFRVSGTEDRAFAIWAREFAEKKALSTNAKLALGILTTFNGAYPIFCLGVIFGVYLFIVSPLKATLTMGEFLGFLSAFGQFLGASLVFSSAVISALTVIPLYERLLPIFHEVPEVTEHKSSPGLLSGGVEINHLSFRYKEDSPLVLQDISMSILPGQFVAFVGASGCGKSTIFRLLLGFEKPESGAVYYDGQDLSGLDVRQIRSQIGVVLQSSRPTNGTIMENIIGSRPMTIEDAWEAARLAGLEADIEKLPMGMHTYLSDGGGGISGGQRQRLMIARAIAGRPRLLLFDEATSALDNNTQSIVIRSLENLQVTRIVIAHRLSTIMRADKVIVFSKGEIAESGSYEELIKRDGMLAALARNQML